MLDHMRSAANTWVAKVLLGLLLLSFMMWGIPHSFYGQSSNTIFQSGKSSVSMDDYQFLVQDEVTKYFFQTRQYINPSQFVQIGLAQQTLYELRKNVLLDEEANRMKINASQKSALRLLGDEQFFHGTNGNFDKNFFETFIQQAQIAQKMYLNQLEKTSIRDQITSSVKSNLTMPDVFLSALVMSNNETRDINYITVTPNQIGTLNDPAADVLKSWFETNKEHYRAPEYRKATYITLTPAALAKPDSITETQIKETYEKEIAQFTTKPEMRMFEELRFASRQAADEAAEKLQNGMGFEELAASLKQNIDAIRKGPLAQKDLPTLVGTQIFNLNEGSVSPVINDLQGPILVRINKITPKIVSPLADVSQQIRHQLALEKARQDLSSLVKTIKTDKDDGVSLSELAKKYNLPITTIIVDAKGNDQQGKSIDNIINKENLIDGIFKATIGIDNDALTSDNAVQWYQTDEIINSRDRSLDEVRPQVIKDWKQQETDRLVAQKAQELNDELKKGKTLAQIADENKIEIQQVKGITRLTKNDNLNNDALKAIFSGPNNSTGVAFSNDTQNKLVFKVTNITEPTNTSPDSLKKEEKNQLTFLLQEGVLLQYLTALESEHPVTVNAANIQSIYQQ